MTPAAYRRGGAACEIRYTIADTPVGRVLVATTERGVCAVELGATNADVERALRADFPNATIERSDDGARAWVRGSARAHSRSAPTRAADVPLDVDGTAFQRRVWKALQEIPAGERRSYREVAEAIGQPAAPSRRGARVRDEPRRRSSFPATAWCARTARSPATSGASSASGSCSTKRLGDDRGRRERARRAHSAAVRPRCGARGHRPVLLELRQRARRPRDLSVRHFLREAALAVTDFDSALIGELSRAARSGPGELTVEYLRGDAAPIPAAVSRLSALQPAVLRRRRAVRASRCSRRRSRCSGRDDVQERLARHHGEALSGGRADGHAGQRERAKRCRNIDHREVRRRDRRRRQADRRRVDSVLRAGAASSCSSARSDTSPSTRVRDALRVVLAARHSSRRISRVTWRSHDRHSTGLPRAGSTMSFRTPSSMVAS